MLTISLVSLGVSLGPSVIGTADIRPKGSEGASVPLEDLRVKWKDLHSGAESFALLAWDVELAAFAGRDQEVEALNGWIRSTPSISVKFVCGVGGVGKSRLAAEFSKQLAVDGWAAGFVDLKKPSSFRLREPGTLFVVDYPEERPHEVEAFLTDLASVGKAGTLRVLFLTRRSVDEWIEIVHDSGAASLLDSEPLVLGPVAGSAAHAIFASAQERAAEVLDTVPTPVSEEIINEWLAQAPNTNDLPLFLVAAALHSALHPEDPVVGFAVRDVVDALVERELTRLRRVSLKVGFIDRYSLARLAALACLAGTIPLNQLSILTESGVLGEEAPPVGELKVALEHLHFMSSEGIEALRPDILAAAMTLRVLSRDPDRAPDLLWLGLQSNIEGWTGRLGRLAYDAEVVLGIREPRLGPLLAAAIGGDADRCSGLRETIGPVLPHVLSEAGVAIWQTFLNRNPDEVERARLLVNLAVDLAVSGDFEGALEAGRGGVEVFRRLAETDPARYEPNLATSLTNLSADLGRSGDHEGALDAARGAVEIRRRLAETDPARYEPDLATSLINQSVALGMSGDDEGALEAARGAVKVFRRLAETDPARHEPYLAMSLYNLAVDLGRSGDHEGALDAARGAVEIRRRLAETDPARYESGLAESLSNLSGNLARSGDDEGALEAVRGAVEVFRRLAETDPAQYEPYLARSLGTQGSVFSSLGLHHEAAESFCAGAELMRAYVRRHPSEGLNDLLDDLESDCREASGESPGD